MSAFPPYRNKVSISCSTVGKKTIKKNLEPLDNSKKMIVSKS